VAAQMTHLEIQDDFPELTQEDILSVLAFAANREHLVFSLKVQ
jgi:uncharacterized protein (DUF433 family)